MTTSGRTLTLFTVVLLPLTFISSIYGMNGLDLSDIWNVPTGLIIVLLTMAAIAAVLIIFFRKKQWLLVSQSDLREKI